MAIDVVLEAVTADAPCKVMAPTHGRHASLQMETHRMVQGSYIMSVVQVWFAIFFGSAAFVAPFLNLFLGRQGYSPSQIGLMAAARPWMGAVAGSLGCLVADKFRLHRHDLLTIALLAGSTRRFTRPFRIPSHI
jgi:nitrate/nitrite transporter NarK